VSDFYPGYDGLDCRQQKCWVHLIRDLNEDLWAFPFDEELQKFVSAVKDLIGQIIQAIDRWGLKAKHLRRFKKQVDKFYAAVIDGREYALDVTKNQKRLARYRESLFRFLDEDGIRYETRQEDCLELVRFGTEFVESCDCFVEAAAQVVLKLGNCRRT
jgi:hypothetical protein